MRIGIIVVLILTNIFTLYYYTNRVADLELWVYYSKASEQKWFYTSLCNISEKKNDSDICVAANGEWKDWLKFYKTNNLPL